MMCGVFALSVCGKKGSDVHRAFDKLGFEHDAVADVPFLGQVDQGALVSKRKPGDGVLLVLELALLGFGHVLQDALAAVRQNNLDVSGAAAGEWLIFFDKKCFSQIRLIDIDALLVGSWSHFLTSQEMAGAGGIRREWQQGEYGEEYKGLVHSGSGVGISGRGLSCCK